MLWRPSCFGVRREHSLTCGRLVVGRISVRSHVAPIHDRWMHCSSLRIRYASVRTTGNGTWDERYFDRIRPPVTLNDYAPTKRARYVCALFTISRKSIIPVFDRGNSDQEAFTIVDRLRCRVDYEYRDAYVYLISVRKDFFFSFEKRTPLHL